jgi:hypothetical protein
MLKNTLQAFVILLFLALTSKGQNLPVDQNTGKITYINIIESAPLTEKDVITIAQEFGKAKNWPVKSQDEGTYTIVFNAQIPVEYEAVKPGKKDKGVVKFTFSVFVKAGKYRYILTDFVHEGQNGAGSGGKLENTTADCGKDAMLAKSWVYIKNSTNTQVNALIEEFKKKVKEVQNDPAKQTDW